MKLIEVADPRLAAAMKNVKAYGNELNKAAKRRDRQMLKINRKSSEFETRAKDIMYPGITLDEFVDEMTAQGFPQGDPEIHYFDWEETFNKLKVETQ